MEIQVPVPTTLFKKDVKLKVRSHLDQANTIIKRLDSPTLQVWSTAAKTIFRKGAARRQTTLHGRKQIIHC
jgi:hypothetical protein